MYRRIFLFVIWGILLKTQSKSQSLSGTWVESSKHNPSPLDLFFLSSTDDIMELSLSSDSLLSGVIHSNYTKGRYTHVKIAGIVHWKDSTVIIKDKKILDHNFNMRVYNYCYGIEFLTLSISDNKYILAGKWKDMSTRMIRCPTQNIIWIKSLFDSSRNEQQNKRIMDIQDLIEIEQEETDSIKCAIYDNGEIDDDTVSIFYDDAMILSKQRLSAKPLEFIISLSKDRRTHVLKMYAENMGRIPPNTAVLVITTRKNRYIINLESNFSNNGSVQFFLKE
jgi:hypothetical protein